ncbi:Integral membrane protein [Ophiophagus hannah]|uniref:Integral membrane protein n=1 Tax=Ophiophagus hannah TaxID=8665 RepID=V8P4Z1_OPHHA|nr:Integral membrane protein [Ophiophagus hannah]
MEALEWDAPRNGSLLPTLSPAVPPYVKLGLTVAYTVFYSLLFLFIYIQLWLVLHYRHKRFSYQTVFLFLCLLWASLRTVLFSFYFKDFVAANSLSPFAFWLLYCFPVCLQFFTLTLMNLYFTQVIFKAKSKYSPELLKYRLPLYLVSFVVSLLFLLVNLTCAVLVKLDNSERRIIVLVRVAINDTLFVLCAISLSVCLYKISKMTLANIYLESKTNPGIVPTHAFNPRTYFFDNPRRYDSDDDLAWSISPHSIYGSFSPESYDWGYLNNSLMVQVGSLQHDFISDSQRRSPI